jgi:UDPglucose--hexose-1-phosphate uridylyltransferase
VSIVGHRQGRPNLPDDGCPFCVGGLEAPEPYDVRSFTNRWPAFAPGAPIDLATAEATGTRTLDAVGTTEVVLFSPDHDATLGSLPVAHVRKVVDTWADRTAALYERDDVEYVLVFENRGAEVGATISHPHGQIYAFGFVPPVPQREADVARAHGCPLCTEVADELADGARIVYESDSWIAYVPFASSWSYGVRVVAREHVASLPALDGARRDGLATALVDVLGRYDRMWTEAPRGGGAPAPGPFPYLLWFHQAAKRDTDGLVHVHAHTAPPLRAPGVMRFVASGELGGGTLSNPVVPEDAAATLRAL